jgi:hypothetical protein
MAGICMILTADDDDDDEVIIAADCGKRQPVPGVSDGLIKGRF